MDARTTRRETARRAIALGGGTLAAGAIPALIGASGAAAKGATETEVVEHLIDIAQSAEVAYRTAADGDLLDLEVAKAAELFAEQEREHASALIAALEDLGGERSKPPSASDVDGLDEPDTQSKMLEFLIDLENSAIEAYYEAAGEVLASDLIKTAAEIGSNEAQHLVVLRQQLGDDPVPEAFVTGDGD